MKVSLEWLGEFVSPLPPAARVAEALTMGGLPVENIETVGPDTVLDVEVTSNRADCLCVVGVAREVAALLGLTFKAPVVSPVVSNQPAAVSVRIDARDLCPSYTARLVRGVKVAPSPAWMQRRLTALGQRPINNIVDITNYVLFETGQPLHGFDFAKIGSGQIVVRRAARDERMTTLDGVERTLSESMLVIADANRPLVIAGIMGGLESGVNDDTVDVLIESARFDPMSTRKTSRTLGLASDSSYRFERGLDPTGTLRASDRAVELLTSIAGGSVVGPVVRDGDDSDAAARADRVILPVPTIARVLGVEWPLADCTSALTRLGFNVSVADQQIHAQVPSHRGDIRIPVDLVEEIARVVGYQHIPTRDQVPIRLAAFDNRRASIDLIRRTLNACGFFEALTFSFVSDTLSAEFTHDEAASLHRVDPRTRKADGRLRPSVLPNLLESIRINESSGTSGAKLFEIASTFWIDAQGNSVERRSLGIVGDDNYNALRGAIENLLATLDANRKVSVVPGARAGFGAGAVGQVRWGEEPIGFIGHCDRAVAEKLGLRTLPAMAELFVRPLVEGTQHVPQLAPLPRYPAVRRDLSLLVSESVRFEQIQNLVVDLKLPHLESLEHVTTYRGKPLEKGQKSVTITLCFRAADATLTSEAVEASVSRVISAAPSIGASLRA